jgi:hypothetical protein
MTLRKREATGNLMRKHSIALSGELALEEAMNVSQGGLRNGRLLTPWSKRLLEADFWKIFPE